MDSSTQQLRDAGIDPEVRFEEVDVTEVMELALCMARAWFPESMVVSTNYGEQLPPVRANANLLSEVFLLQLIGGARAMGGLESGRQRSLGVTIGSTPKGEVLVSVTDQGEPLIDESPAPRCEGIVRRFGGRISKEFRPSDGNTSTITLPSLPKRRRHHNLAEALEAALPN